jgi:hypothetical protein
MTRDTAVAARNTLRLVVSLALMGGLWLGYQSGLWPVLLRD